MTPSFRVPLIGTRVPLGALGVRVLAASSLLGSAGLIAALAAGAPPAGREHLVPPIVVGLSLLAIIAAVPALLDGRLRFPLAGIASLCLGLLAATSVGLGASSLAGGLAWLVVVVSGATAVYHLLGADAEADTEADTGGAP